MQRSGQYGHHTPKKRDQAERKKAHTHTQYQRFFPLHLPSHHRMKWLLVCSVQEVVPIWTTSHGMLGM